MSETLTGTHKFLGNKEEKFIEFNITWGPDNIWEWLNPFSENFMTQKLEGTIFAEGIGGPVNCEGILSLKYHKGYIEYEIYFEHNCRKYIYKGRKKNLRPWNLHITHTTCYGEIWRVFGGEWKDLLSQSIMHFKLEAISSFVRSFRFVRNNE